MISQALLIRHRAEDLTESARGSTLWLASQPKALALSSRLANNKTYQSAMADASRFFSSFAASTDSISEIVLLHPETGEVVASSNLAYKGKTFSQKPYFQAAKEGFIFDMALNSRDPKKSILEMATPVQNSGKKTLAVLAIRIDPGRLEAALDAGNKVKAHFAGQSRPLAPGQSNGKEAPMVTGPLSEPAKLGLSGKTGSGIFRSTNGKKVISAYTLIEPLGLALVLEKPLQDVLGGINSNARRTQYILLGFAFMIIILSILAGTRLATTINAMSRGSKEIALGNFDLRPGLRTRYELGHLGRSMSHMARSLDEGEREKTELIEALETLLNHMPEGIALLDPKGKVIIINKIIEEHLPVLAMFNDQGEVVSIAGKPLSHYIFSHLDIEWATVTSGADSEDASPPNGYRKFRVAVRDLSADSNAVSGSVLIIKEVTETQKIRQVAYNQEKMAAVGQLAAGIAHDFNNLLTSIIGFSELLLDDQRLPPDVVMQIEAINISGSRASDLVSQLVDFSRKSVTEPEFLEIKGAVDEFIHLMADRLPGNVHLSQEAETRPFNARVDPAKLQQVLTNLTMNACDAMPEGGHVVFRISSESVRDGQPPPLPGIELDRWVLLSITDDGEGIPEDILPHIFEPFYTSKGSSKGTGLGLAQVYGIIRQHDGYITVKSANRKTTFNIYLPESTDMPEH